MTKDIVCVESASMLLPLPSRAKAEARGLDAACHDAVRHEGTSVNQFVATAVAEKVGALRAAGYFAERRARADWAAFDRLMARRGGAQS